MILGWIGNDTLKVIKNHKKKEKEVKIPESKLHEIKKYKDFYLDIDHRTSTGGGAGLFNFDTLYFTRDSVYFLQHDSLGEMKGKLGLIKGQLRLSIENDTINMINGTYYEKEEDLFSKITACLFLRFTLLYGRSFFFRKKTNQKKSQQTNPSHPFCDFVEH